jgi:hypothetical protein
MYRYTLPYPTAPGKTEEDIKSIVTMLRERIDEYRESRGRLGITVERVFLQQTPMGAVVLAYLESDRDLETTTRLLAASDLEVDRRFIDMVAEVHGIDMRQPPPGPPPETVAEWVDPDVTTRKRGHAFIVPLRPDKIEAVRAFTREAFIDRVLELTESRRALGLNVNVATLSSNPMGDFLCVYREGDDTERASREFAASDRPFDRWFKDRLAELTEVDFNQPMPPVQQLWDYVAMAQVRR